MGVLLLIPHFSFISSSPRSHRQRRAAGGHADPWQSRLSQRASHLFLFASLRDPTTSSSHTVSGSSATSRTERNPTYTCRQLLCLFILPCLLLCILLLAVSNAGTYVSVVGEMQGKVDAIRDELEEQRTRDGGVFMPYEKKEEMERKADEVERVRRELQDLTVGERQYTAKLQTTELSQRYFNLHLCNQLENMATYNLSLIHI